jgi:hypothetical protein
LLQRVESEFGKEARAVIDAVISTGGDVGAIAKKVGPIALAKLHVHMQKAPPGVSEAWNMVHLPLKASWTPPKEASAIAEQFLERYAAGLEELGDRAARAAKAAGSLAASLKTLTEAKELTKAVSDLHAQAKKFVGDVERCSHPDPNKPGVAGEALDLSNEAQRTVSMVRQIHEKAADLARRVEELRSLITEWTDLPPAEKASRAESMAARISAARSAALSMHEEFASVVLHASN